MRLPRFRVRTMILSVAVAAALLGGGLGYARLKRLSNRYRYLAWGYGENVRMRLQDLTRVTARLKQLRGSPSEEDRRERQALGLTAERLRAEVAANANLVEIYE